MTVGGAIIDLDGTVYRGDELLPGASTGVDALRDVGLDLLFFSNNPTKDGDEYVEHLSGLGLDVRPGEACSAGVATTEYLDEHHADDTVYLIGSEALADQLRSAGLTITDNPDRTDVLVASWTPTFGYEDLDDALRAAPDGTPFLGTDPDRVFPEANDRFVPGSGAIIGSVAAVLGREPDAILGKPSEASLSLALDRLGVPPAECLVVGDRLDTDLAMGDRAGMTTVLVCSGVADPEDIPDSNVDPDYVLDGLGDIETVLDDLV
ncbi:HAD-IIA family hydrolase [Halovenus marina]|uniref:HAD-IIA family hydrolase n=1 Tax=Halovenus marina TaxID=3396621 RepID=UPI003F56E4CE